MKFTGLVTSRLILRGFREDDFPAVHGWASCPANVRFMLFGPNTEDETRAFIKTLGLHRITARCDAENYASYHVMEKTGMRREGRFVKARRGNAVLGREWRDEFAYGILREEWENITRRVTQ